MKTFFESLREHTMKMINLKTMKLLTNKQKNPYLNSKICYICKEKLEEKYAKKKKTKNIVKLGTIVNLQRNVEVLHVV